MTVNEAIVSSYLAGTRDTLKDAAITLRTSIKKAFDKSTSLKRPATVDELGALTQNQLLEELLKFLNVAFSGQDSNQRNMKRRAPFDIFNWSRFMPCCYKWRVETCKTCSYVFDNSSPLSQ